MFLRDAISKPVIVDCVPLYNVEAGRLKSHFPEPLAINTFDIP